jgi:hypothetical protein
MSFEPQASYSSQSWSLLKGQAQTFIPSSAGVLRVKHGQVWATLNASSWSPQPRWCPEIDAGDVFVMPGHDLSLKAGQRVVIESWPVGDVAGSQLQWEPAAVSQRSQRWQQSVVQPVHELGRGLAVVARAVLQLAAGLVGYGEFLVAGRGKVQSCLESNAP